MIVSEYYCFGHRAGALYTIIFGHNKHISIVATLLNTLLWFPVALRTG